MIITKISPQKRNKNRFSVFVDDIFSFSLDQIDLAKVDLHENDTISKSEIDSFKNLYEYSSAKNKALRYLTSRMRTMSEIRNKLQMLGFSSSTIDKVVTDLIELGYINDEEYIDAFINDTLKIKPKGKRLIELTLREKGIDYGLITQKLNSIGNNDEENLARKLLDKKFKNTDLADKKTLNKIYLFLMRKGFNSDLIAKILHSYTD